MPARIPLDPKLPRGFHDTPNEDRSKAELDAWWDKPYGVTLPDGKIEVQCLNGGAWDRPTHLGVADDYEAACELAEQAQAKWLTYRSKPSLSMDEGSYSAVRMAQRPDQQPQVLKKFDSIEEASTWMREHFPME